MTNDEGPPAVPVRWLGFLPFVIWISSLNFSISLFSRSLSPPFPSLFLFQKLLLLAAKRRPPECGGRVSLGHRLGGPGSCHRAAFRRPLFPTRRPPRKSARGDSKPSPGCRGRRGSPARRPRRQRSSSVPERDACSRPPRESPNRYRP